MNQISYAVSKRANIDFLKNEPNQNHNLLTDKFINIVNIVNEHAPLKKKIVRGNFAPFINREF